MRIFACSFLVSHNVEVVVEEVEVAGSLVESVPLLLAEDEERLVVSVVAEGRDVTVAPVEVEVGAEVLVAEVALAEELATGVASSAFQILTPWAGTFTFFNVPENTPRSLPQLVERARMVWRVVLLALEELTKDGNWEETELQEGGELVFCAHKSYSLNWDLRMLGD
jgi:hypothetical protein